jgi:integrase
MPAADQTAEAMPSGHTQVKPDRKGRGRSYWAYWRDAEGRHGRRLGPAHVKDSGRRSPRGAVIWRAGDGPKPTAGHLAPKDAQAQLEKILAQAPRLRRGARRAGTLGEALEGWLAERISERGLKPNTVAGYEDMFERLYRDLGEETPVTRLHRDQLRDYFAGFESQRPVSRARAKREKANGAQVRSLTIQRWIAQPADSVAVEVSTKTDAMRVAREMGGGKWKHERRGVYRVTPPGSRRPRRMRRAEALRLEAEGGWIIERRETERWMIVGQAAAQTRNHYRDILSASLDYAVRRGWIDVNPLADVARMSMRAHRRKVLRRDDFYDRDEIDRLLAEAPGAFEATFWLCGFHAGMRLPGEGLGLRWGAVDFDAGVVRIYDNWVGNELVTTKTDDSAPVPMTDRLRDGLSALKRRGYRTSDEDFVFTRDPLGRPAAAKDLREAFKAARAAAGLKPIPMYNARHSFGTRLALHGVDVRTIQALMRHSRLTTTEQYMAYSPQPDLADRISRALEAPMPAQALDVPTATGAGDADVFFDRLSEEIPAKWMRKVAEAYAEAGYGPAPTV